MSHKNEIVSKTIILLALDLNFVYAGPEYIQT